MITGTYNRSRGIIVLARYSVCACRPEKYPSDLRARVMNQIRDHGCNCRTVLLLWLVCSWPHEAVLAAEPEVYDAWEVKEHFGLRWPAQAVHRGVGAQTAARLEQVRAALEVVD